MTYFYLNDKRKIRNPCFEANKNEYDGDINNFNFTDKDRNINQQNNFDMLKETLDKFDFSFDYVLSGTNENDLTKFLVYSDNRDFVWYKYEGKTKGGSQNNLFVCGNKVKLTSWLEMTYLQRKELFNSFKN